MSKEKRDHIEELLRKSLLGDEVLDIQFYLFSAKSVSSNTVVHPRVLCANNDLLTNASMYFSDLLNSTTSDLSLSSIDVTGDDQQIPNEAHIDDYGYGSDSDLDDDDDPPSKPQKVQSDASSASPSPENLGPALGNDHGSSEGGRDSVASDISILELGNDRGSAEARPSVGEFTAQPLNQTVVLLPPASKRRRIFVKDTAFKTWYTLLYYFYTGQVTFLPLKSACMWSWRSLPSSLKAPMCSAKSMYRLARKVGLETLCDQALVFLRNSITEQNILKELTSSLLSRYPPLLDMLLDVLYEHIASGPVISGFPALARRIASKELPHGADIVVGLHQRLVKAHRANIPQILRFPSPVDAAPEEEFGLGWGHNDTKPATVGVKKNLLKNGKR